MKGATTASISGSPLHNVGDGGRPKDPINVPQNFLLVCRKRSGVPLLSLKTGRRPLQLNVVAIGCPDQAFAL